MKKLFKIISISLAFSIFLITGIFAASKSKKGVLFHYDVDDVVDLNCGVVAINYTLGVGFGVQESTLKELHDKGIKIAFIVTSNYPVNRGTLSGNPAPYNAPRFYMPDVTKSETSKAFESMLDTYGKYVDYYIIGNEINDQQWNYYKPAPVEEYTKEYCRVFGRAYREIKKKKSSAKVFIPFDNGWAVPAYDKTSNRYNAAMNNYKYNYREMLQIIQQEIGNLDWGVAPHPYNTRMHESPNFWDDVYAGPVDAPGVKEPNKAMLITMKNIEVLCNFLASEEMRRSGGPREILISEIGFSDNEGDELEAAALTYAWKKVENNNQILGFIINTGDFPMSGAAEEAFRKLGTSKQKEAEDLMQRVLGGVNTDDSSGESYSSSGSSSSGSSSGGGSSGGGSSSGGSSSGGTTVQETAVPKPQSVAGINPNTGANDMLVPYMEDGTWKLAWQQEINEYNALKASGDTYVVSYQTTVDGYGDTVLATLKIKNPENLSSTVNLAIPTGEQPVIYYGCYPLLLAEKYVGGEEVKVSGEISSKPQ